VERHQIMRAVVDWSYGLLSATRGWSSTRRLLQYWFYRAPVEGRAWAERMLAATPTADQVSIGLMITTKASCTFARGTQKAR
jgi:hypothetical protein